MFKSLRKVWWVVGTWYDSTRYTKIVSLDRSVFSELLCMFFNFTNSLVIIVLVSIFPVFLTVPKIIFYIYLCLLCLIIISNLIAKKFIKEIDWETYIKTKRGKK